MMRIIGVEFIAENSRSIEEHNIIDRVDDSNKVDRTKFQVDFQKNLPKYQNRVSLSLVKSLLLTEPSSRLHFLTFGTRLVFVELG